MKELFPLHTFHQDAVLKRLSELYENEVDLDSRVEDLEDVAEQLPTIGDSDVGKMLVVNSDHDGYDLQNIPQEVPEPSLADAGKYIGIGVDGKYALSNPTAASITGVDIAPKDVTASGNITGASIIENMVGYSGSFDTKENVTITGTYLGIVKNGNKITFVAVGEITRTGDIQYNLATICDMDIPSSIGQKLYPVNNTWISFIKSYFADSYYSGVEVPVVCSKASDTHIQFNAYELQNLTLNTKYYFRLEQTFLLSDSLVTVNP